MPSPVSFPYPFPQEIQTSLHILGYPENTPPSSLKDLNKRYHILALQHHPDKVISSLDATDPSSRDDATERFKQVNEAHKCLRDYFYMSSGFEYSMEDNTTNTGYDSILQLFIKSVLSKMTVSSTSSTSTTDAIHSLIHHIITKGLQSAMNIFRSMDKNSIITIYDILSKNQELFGISRETMDELTLIMEEKTRNDIVIRLNPSLLDMLLDRVFILHESGHTYYIPLWHSELHFKIASSKDSLGEGQGQGQPGKGNIDGHPQENPQDRNDGEVIVLCEPELPENVTMDDNNNIYISLDVSVSDLFRQQVLLVVVNEEIKTHGFVYYLHACDVTLRSDIRQQVLLRGCSGIATINSTLHTADMYKVDKRASVYANIRLVT